MSCSYPSLCVRAKGWSNWRSYAVVDALPYRRALSEQILKQIQECGSFLPEAKLLITQQLPTRLQQEDTDFCEVLWQNPLSTFATQVEAKPQAAEKEPQTLLCKDKNCAKQMCWVTKGRGTQKRQET